MCGFLARFGPCEKAPQDTKRMAKIAPERPKTGKYLALKTRPEKSPETTLKSASIGVKFSLILPLVFQQRGVVFPVVWILFFVERMDPAAVLLVAVDMVELRPTLPKDTPS